MGYTIQYKDAKDKTVYSKKKYTSFEQANKAASTLKKGGKATDVKVIQTVSIAPVINTSLPMGAEEKALLKVVEKDLKKVMGNLVRLMFYGKGNKAEKNRIIKGFNKIVEGEKILFNK